VTNIKDLEGRYWKGNMQIILSEGEKKQMEERQ
jgi:hypothetical protein